MSKDTVKRQCQKTLSKDTVKRHCQKTLSKDSVKRQCQKTVSKDSVKRHCQKTLPKDTVKRHCQKTLSKDAVKRHCQKPRTTHMDHTHGPHSRTTHTTHVVKRAQQCLYFLRRLREFNMGPRILRTSYTSTIKSVLTGCITVWYGKCTALERRALQRVVRTAQFIVGGELPSLCRG